MNTKSTYMGLLAMAAMMGSGSFATTSRPFIDDSKTDEEIKRKHKANLLKKGVREFTLHGHTVLARNEANAIKKVKKILKQNNNKGYEN